MFGCVFGCVFLGCVFLGARVWVRVFGRVFLGCVCLCVFVCVHVRAFGCACWVRVVGYVLRAVPPCGCARVPGAEAGPGRAA